MLVIIIKNAVTMWKSHTYRALSCSKTHTTYWPVSWLFEGSIDEATVLRQLFFELQLSASLTYTVKA